MLLCLLALDAGGSGALGAPRFVLGIGDQSPRMLNDVRFQRLGLRHMRVVVPYDMALDARQLARYAPVLDLARARRVRVLVAFNHSARAPRRLPRARQYARAMAALDLPRFGGHVGA